MPMPQPQPVITFCRRVSRPLRFTTKATRLHTEPTIVSRISYILVGSAWHLYCQNSFPDFAVCVTDDTIAKLNVTSNREKWSKIQSQQRHQLSFLTVLESVIKHNLHGCGGCKGLREANVLDPILHHFKGPSNKI